MKTSISKKNCLYFCWLVPLTWAGHNLFKWLKIVTFQSKFDKTTSFYQHAQLLHHVLQKRIESLEFVPCVNFEFVDSLKNSGARYLLIFTTSCEKSCNSKAFVDIATARRQRWSSTIYNRHIFFHQSKLGRDVEFQKTHIVLFKSPRDVMQVSTHIGQLGPV